MICAAAVIHGERLPVKTYTVADGLLRDSVTKIRQDSRGFLWFCSLEGLSRFDGIGFTNFTTDDGLPHRTVNDFLETKSGTYLIATDSGLAQLRVHGMRGSTDNPLFVPIPLTDNDSTITVRSLVENALDGSVWIGTSAGLFSLSETDGAASVTRVDLPTGSPVSLYSLFEDSRGSLYLGSRGQGLAIRRSDGTTTLFDTNFSAFAEDAKGRVWAAFAPGLPGKDQGLARLKQDPRSNGDLIDITFDADKGLSNPRVLSLHAGADGRLWTGTIAGTCVLNTDDDSRPFCEREYKAANGICDTQTWTFQEDRDDNMWIGTQCGVKKLSRHGFTSYSMDDGLAWFAANSIFENRDGDLFVSVNTPGRPISRFNGTRFESVKPAFSAATKGWGWGWQQMTIEDSTGDWWLPTGQGLYKTAATDFSDLDATMPKLVDFGAGIPEIFRIYEDSRHDVWIATIEPSGLHRWDRSTNTWHDHSRETGLSAARIPASFVEDRSGNLWIGTGADDASALLRYRDGVFKVFTNDDGAPRGWTRGLLTDAAGRLWLANNTEGLLRLDAVNADRLEFVRYTTANGMSTNAAYCLTDDDLGRIYIGSGRGIDRLDPATGQIEHFTTADGLPDSYIQVAHRDRKNVLWFGTMNGLARFVPAPPRPRLAPTILVSAVRVAGVPQKVSILGESDIRLGEFASDERQLAIDFTAVGANPGEILRHEYRLNSDEWQSTAERTLNIAGLSADSYRLELRAVTADRIYSAHPASVTFSIASPMWRRPWFLASITLLAGFLGYAFYRNRLTRALDIERTRTRIATDLHDDIGSNLSKISLLSDLAKMQQRDGAESERLLDSIAAISRESVSSMSDIVWAISPQRDSITEMTRRMRSHAEEIFVEKGVGVIFEVPKIDQSLSLSMNVRRDLYLIFKEAVNNAAKYSGCKNLEVGLTLAGRDICLRISDDGRGFDATNGHEGNGLANMQKRAEAAGGKFEIDSELGRGTTIRATVPQG